MILINSNLLFFTSLLFLVNITNIIIYPVIAKDDKDNVEIETKNNRYDQNQHYPQYNNNQYNNNQHKTIKLPKNKAIPGGIAIIPLDLNTINQPKVLFEGKQILVVNYNDLDKDHQNKDHRNIYRNIDRNIHLNIDNKNSNFSKEWIAIVGIPMETKPGLHKISIFLNQLEDGTFEEHIEKSFFVVNYKYPFEKLKLSQNFVTPSYAEQLRIDQEQQLIKKAYKHRSILSPSLTFFKPVDGRKSSPFGLKRILNGVHKGFHSGLDLAAPIGTKVTAASYGRVILIGNFFYTGNSIFIEHGQNLITSYSHLDNILVKEGDLVNNKTVIGTVGMTGRSTGPHLHWTVSLNNVRVNPELFLVD